MELNTSAGEQPAGGLSSGSADTDAVGPASRDKKGRAKGDSLYYRVKCRDNGVGMPHDKVLYFLSLSLRI